MHVTTGLDQSETHRPGVSGPSRMKPKKGKRSPSLDRPAPEEPPSAVNHEEENQFLKAKLAELTRALEEAQQSNAELSKAKEALSDEIVDLTKVLFEEANGMVANEVRARTQLEQVRRKLQTELEQTKDRLRLESQQLGELRQKLYQITVDHSNISLNSALMNSPNVSEASLDQAGVSGSYFEVLFPDRRFNSKAKCNGPSSAAWERIIGSVDMRSFQAFSKFLQIIEELGEEELLGSPFVRSIYENDIAPCLNFYSKPKTFVRKIVGALFKNTCSIEEISPASPLPSPLGQQPPEGDAESEYSVNVMISEMTLSFSALPDLFGADPKQSKFCYFCGSSLCTDRTQPLYRFRLEEKETPMIIDEPCRIKLVAAAEFYTFLRQLRRGIYYHRPIIDLYLELLHFLRNMFYARTHSYPFFVQSDFETLHR